MSRVWVNNVPLFAMNVYIMSFRINYRADIIKKLKIIIEIDTIF